MILPNPFDKLLLCTIVFSLVSILVDKLFALIKILKKEKEENAKS